MTNMTSREWLTVLFVAAGFVMLALGFAAGWCR